MGVHYFFHWHLSMFEEIEKNIEKCPNEFFPWPWFWTFWVILLGNKQVNKPEAAGENISYYGGGHEKLPQVEVKPIKVFELENSD